MLGSEEPTSVTPQDPLSASMPERGDSERPGDFSHSLMQRSTLYCSNKPSTLFLILTCCFSPFLQKSAPQILFLNSYALFILWGIFLYFESLFLAFAVCSAINIHIYFPPQKHCTVKLNRELLGDKRLLTSGSWSSAAYLLPSEHS